jgi:hypothetical protein
MTRSTLDLKWLVSWTVMAVTTCAAAPGLAEGPSQQVQRPPYQDLRYQEDWSVLAGKDRSQTGDLFDPIKYAPLTEDGSVWVSFGGQIRERVEVWNNFNFGAPVTADHDDVFLLSRVRVHGDLHVGEHMRVFVEGKSALETDRSLTGGRRTVDTDELDLQNGFVDLSLRPFDGAQFTLRAGRQEMAFGRQRLVSPLDWANTRRTFDGASGIFKLQGWTVTGFWTLFVPVQKYNFNTSDLSTQFYGIYASGKVPLAQAVGLDLYWMGLQSDVNAFTGTPFARYNGTVGREERHTLGGRLWGKVATTGIDYELEGAFQVGRVGAGSVDAFMITGQLGYTFAEFPAAPRLQVGLDYASGDDKAGGDVHTFNQLFPLGHAYFGYIDTVGRQNIIDVNPGFSVQPFTKLVASLEGHLFWRADTRDALYNAGGNVVRAGSAGSSSEIGSEIDLLFKYQFDRHLLGLLGYNHFFAGDFIRESGPSKDINFAYLTLQYTF